MAHNDGLRKRCTCGHRKWAKCLHPWWFGFQWEGREYRFSLHKITGRALSYFMTRTEAESLRDLYRSQIRSGTFNGGVLADSAGSPATEQHAATVDIPASAPLTLGQVADLYLEQHARIPGRRPLGRKMMEWHVAALRRIEIPRGNGRPVRLESVPIAEITKADIEAVRRIWRAHLPRAKGGEVGVNRLLSRLRHMFNWAIAEGYLDHSPFKRNGVTVVKLSSWAEAPRHRRLEEGEEERLLAAANPRLRNLIVAALETGCRLGELLSLQWHQVRWSQNVIYLPSERTKTAEPRVVPISGRLRRVLERRQYDTAGDVLGRDAFVFGNEVGERVRSIKTAWANCRRRAGVTGLHFHDLRREFGSRLRESGASDHDVRDWLGHTNITTTSRYLATTQTRLQHVLEGFERFRESGGASESHGGQDEGGRGPSSQR